ncbi:solute carrier family 15 member 5 [Engystomops pustulosus]|uniref:solute carrier family 15 member 5 n=1 Tax=Engystomops pustulosus TaxID=76066 RepID=UPI003AFAF807
MPHFVHFVSFQSSHRDRSSFWRKDVESTRTGARKSLQPIVLMLLVDLCERFTFFATVCNMILFCTLKLGYQSHQAAMVNLCFVGASTLMPVLVGWVAELCTMRTRVIYICTFLHVAGTALLPVVAFPFEDFYIDRHHMAHTLGRTQQMLLFYVGLLMASAGTGGIRAIVCPISAYGLQGHGQKEVMSFFNWFYWLVNLNSLVVFVGISYIQQSVAKNLGFLIPFMSIVMALITIHMVRHELIHQPTKAASLRMTLGVFINAGRMSFHPYRHVGGHVSSWLDRAKEYHGGCFSELQVENVKLLLRLLPLFGLQVLYRICTAQVSSGYFIQSMNSNLSLNGFLLPVAAMKVISIIPVLLLAPCLESVHSFLMSSRRYRQLPYMAIVCGQVVAAASLLIAGIYEIHRKGFPVVEQTLSGKVLLVSSMSCLHLTPQYIFLGMAEAMVAPACSFITFCLAPTRIRGVCMTTMTTFQALGCFLGALLIEVTFIASKGDWFPDVLAGGHLELLFFVLALGMLVNSVMFWWTSHRFWDLEDQCDQGLKSSFREEKLLLHERSLRFYTWPTTFGPIETTL